MPSFRTELQVANASLSKTGFLKKTQGGRIIIQYLLAYRTTNNIVQVYK